MIEIVSMALIMGLSAGFSPGPLMALVVTQTIRHGVKEGIVTSSVPIITDAPIVILAFLMVSRLTAIGPVLGAVSALGGLYVLYLAWETVHIKPVLMETGAVQARSLRKGVLVNFLSPHPYLFWFTVGAPFVLNSKLDAPLAAALFMVPFYCLLIGSKIAVAIIIGRFRGFMAGPVYLYIMRFLGAALAVFALLLLHDALIRFGLLVG